jgi:signal transduction histidine kinase
MLGEGMVRDEQQRQEYYGTIRAESERLSRMIGNVLELGKLERGAVDVNLQCGALRPVLEEMRALLAPHIAAQGFRLEIDCPEDLPPALFDRELLLQVLVNVCDNSLKFAAEAADKRICIDARQVQEGVRLSLRDFGPGVAPAHLPRIFDSFYRGEDELTRRHKGSGIGLALVRGLVERMRGRVAAANHPQGGFQLSLVLAVA